MTDSSTAFETLPDIKARLTRKALSAMEQVLDSGSETNKIAAAKLILDRTMPVSKVDAKTLSGAAAIGGAVAGGLAAIADKALQRERQTAADTAKTVQPSSSVVFSPYSRVRKESDIKDLEVINDHTPDSDSGADRE